MRTFLATLAVSTVSPILLWNFGLAQRISPSHPILTTTLIGAGAGILVQLLLSEERVAKLAKKY